MLDIVRTHLDSLIEFGTDRYGGAHTPMFMATLDPDTLAYPADDTRTETITKAYRLIHAPRGCSAYWDQPTLSAMYACANLIGEPRYRDSADAYLRFFMERCVSESGVFYWGNHYFYHAFDDVTVEFNGGFAPDSTWVRPVNRSEPPLLHELRPLSPDWELLYKLNPSAVDRHIREMAAWHVFDANGGFNRHSDRKSSCAFLEAGAILTYSLLFLYAKTDDPALLEDGLKIARYSFRNRHPDTGLLLNNPTQTRWDGRMSTSEVGLWSRLLLQAARRIRPLAPEAAEELAQMGKQALLAYERHAYDAGSGRYYGRLWLDGKPDLGEQTTPYQPGVYSSIWSFLFPTHDYPISCAFASLDAMDEDPAMASAARRWAEAVKGEAFSSEEPPARFADNYGKAIAFLAAYGRTTNEPSYEDAARELAGRALGELRRGRLLVGHRKAHWYDAIDGVGYLLLAVLYLEGGDGGILEQF